ncbi:trimeric intracellular cation channel family protein (plasmid) [Enterobacter asburiae]|uniref:trimeric intracellular cation channel family protein n=1 Tax=Enterobacter asburiae TaxID=61645 RepID=UPI00388D8D08
MQSFLQYIDLFGTFIFALSGAIAGVSKGYDIFGVYMVSSVTAIGGGVIRDVLISATPPAGLINFECFLVITIAIACTVFYSGKNIFLIKANCFI